jgi:ubiquinone/menaquinone biosynthesis C-methylase UbiE
MNRLIRFAFQHFYTTFAWTYDAVARVVSFGEWLEWGRAAIPFLPREGRVLEIAHGPGHLHLALRQQGFDVVGMDLSRQMGRLIQQRLQNMKHPERSSIPPSEARGDGAKSKDAPLLVRGSALRLPFADGAFTGTVSTFPAGFIFHRDCLNDVHRVLQPDGRFVIVPGAAFRTEGISTEAVKFAYRVTGQGETSTDAVRPLFERAGFAFEAHTVQTKRANVTVWVLNKTSRVSETREV